MKINTLLGKKTAIWGMGVEGTALMDFFRGHGISADVLDEVGAHILDYDIIFKSPGISLYHPQVVRARAAGVTISSATNLFMANKSNRMKTIAVTGTKGKSTTSSLMAHVLRKLGFHVGFGGNIGRPLIELWGQDFDFLVAELSSYQTADLAIGFDVSIITNLYPEHIDWHCSHDQYYRDKLRILDVRSPGQAGFVNAQNERSLTMTQGMDHLYYFNETIDPVPCILIGDHNQQNIDAVRAVLRYLGLPSDNLADLLADFIPLPHRLEVFGPISGITYVDDSISTTPETAVAALQSFENKRRILLVGGYDRKQDYGVLIDYARGRDVIFIALPDTGARVAEAALRVCIPVHFADTVEEGALLARQLAHPGDVVILSPGAPSYHQFKNFEVRGDVFKKAVLG